MKMPFVIGSRHPLISHQNNFRQTTRILVLVLVVDFVSSAPASFYRLAPGAARRGTAPLVRSGHLAFETPRVDSAGLVFDCPALGREMSHSAQSTNGAPRPESTLAYYS